MPTETVGSTYRIDPATADTWRRERGRRPTTSPTTRKTEDVDVDLDLERAGLRLVGRAR